MSADDAGDVLICKVCGTENRPGTEFCTKCRSFLEWNAEKVSREPQARTPTGPVPARSGEPEQRLPPLIRIEPSGVTVAPGRKTTLTVTVTNRSEIVDRLVVTHDGPDWATVEPGSVSLWPGRDGTVALTVAPPRRSDVPAGPLALRVRVANEQRPGLEASAEVALQVEAYDEVAASITPRTSSGRRTGRHQVAVANKGNAPWSASVSGSDPDDSLVIDARPPTLAVAPGSTGTSQVAVRAKSTMLRGAEQHRPFTVRLEPPNSAAIALDGAFRQRALLSTLTLVGLAAGIVALVVGGVALAGVWPPVPSSGSVAIVTEVPPTSPPTTPPTDEVTDAPEESATNSPVTAPPSKEPAWLTAEIRFQHSLDVKLGARIGTVTETSEGGFVQHWAMAASYQRPDGSVMTIRGGLFAAYACDLTGVPLADCVDAAKTQAMTDARVEDPGWLLGYPKGNEALDDTGKPFQEFDGGIFTCTPAICAYQLPDLMRKLWEEVGRSQAIGYPVMDPGTVEGWDVVWFENGVIGTQPEGGYVVCQGDRLLTSDSGATDCVGFESQFAEVRP